jgi:hydrogenase expression/formation protein HypC
MISASDPLKFGSPDDVTHCITCSDEGCPMTVVLIDEERLLALCEDTDGARQSVEIALVEARVGDELLVHAGTALLRL